AGAAAARAIRQRGGEENLMSRPFSRISPPVSGLVIGLIAVAGGWLPAWLVSIVTVALGDGLAVLGMIVLWRSGLVSFGQALYYATGAYAVALAARHLGL